MTAAFGVLRAAVRHHRSYVTILAPAVLAAERTVRAALKGFVVPSIRVVHAAVSHKRAEFRPFLPAVDADERAVLVTLEEGMLSFSGSARMMGAGIREKAFCVRVLLSAVFAVFAHCRSSILLASSANEYVPVSMSFSRYGMVA